MISCGPGRVTPELGPPRALEALLSASHLALGTPTGIRSCADALKGCLSRVGYQGCKFEVPAQRPFPLTARDRRKLVVTVP